MVEREEVSTSWCLDSFGLDLLDTYRCLFLRLAPRGLGAMKIMCSCLDQEINFPQGDFLRCLTKPESSRQRYGRLYTFVVALTFNL